MTTSMQRSAPRRGRGTLWLVLSTMVGAFLTTLFFQRRAGAGASTRTNRARANLTPKPGSEQQAERIRALAEQIKKCWPDVTSSSGPSDAALELALAQAAGETGYGQGWGKDSDMNGSWNIGAYQCSKGSSGGATYKCVEHKDSRPDPANPGGPNIEYTTGFRFYLDAEGRTAAENGARDFLASITVKPFPALEQLKSGSVLDYAARIGSLGYYEGFNPESPQAGSIKDWQSKWSDSLSYLKSRYGAELEKRAARVKATPEQVAGRWCLYARAMGRHLPEIAAALGHSDVAAYLPADLA